MALDLRIVIGRLLLAIGAQLVVYGLMSDGRAASMNIGWGSAIAVTGVVFHVLARMGKTA
ncbi:MAG: hypothetical protein JNM66_01645 [Bryobacterales bacterium]|nr:hypothetical protein [Bryobacterales bacterium]